MPLTEFLLARIAEEGECGRLGLAECDATRSIAAEFERFTTSRDPAATGTALGLRIALLYLALPYADHPDYDEGWKP